MKALATLLPMWTLMGVCLTPSALSSGEGPVAGRQAAQESTAHVYSILVPDDGVGAVRIVGVVVLRSQGGMLIGRFVRVDLERHTET